MARSRMLIPGLMIFLASFLAHGCQARRTVGIDKSKLHLQVGGRTLAEWQRQLNGKSEEQRNALACLSELGPFAADAVPAITHLLMDKDENVRSDAQFALGRIGARAQEAVPYLLEKLRSPTTSEREKGFVIDTLMHVDLSDATGKLVLPWLNYRSPNSDAFPAVSIRINAAVYLGRLGPTAQFALPALRAALDDDVPWVRARVAQALWRVGQEQTAIAALVALLSLERQSAGCIESLRILGEIGPAAKLAIPQLVRIMQEDQEDLVLMEACEALSKIDHNPTALARLIQFLDDREKRERACWALQRIGPAAKSAAPRLLPLLDEKGDDNVATGAAKALWNMEGNPRALEIILRIGSHKDLLELGEAAGPALPRLLEQYHKAPANARYRYSAARLILELDPQAAEKAGIR